VGSAKRGTVDEPVRGVIERTRGDARRTGVDEPEMAGVDEAEEAADVSGSGSVDMPSLLDRWKEAEKVVLRACDRLDAVEAADEVGDATVRSCEVETALT